MFAIAWCLIQCPEYRIPEIVFGFGDWVGFFFDIVKNSFKLQIISIYKRIRHLIKIIIEKL